MGLDHVESSSHRTGSSIHTSHISIISCSITNNQWHNRFLIESSTSSKSSSTTTTRRTTSRRTTNGTSTRTTTRINTGNRLMNERRAFSNHFLRVSFQNQQRRDFVKVIFHLLWCDLFKAIKQTNNIFFQYEITIRSYWSVVSSMTSNEFLKFQSFSST